MPNIVVPKVTLAELNSEQSVVRHENVLFQINIGVRTDPEILRLLKQEGDLRSTCLLQFVENQRLKERLEEQEKLSNLVKRRNFRAEALLAMLVPVTLLSLLSFPMARPLAIGWAVIACCMYVASLLHFTDKWCLPENARMRGALLKALEGFDIRLQRLISGLRD